MTCIIDCICKCLSSNPPSPPPAPKSKTRHISIETRIEVTATKVDGLDLDFVSSPSMYHVARATHQVMSRENSFSQLAKPIEG